MMAVPITFDLSVVYLTTGALSSFRPRPCLRNFSGFIRVSSLIIFCGPFNAGLPIGELPKDRTVT